VKKIILILVFVLVAGLVFAQEPGEFEVSVWPDGEAIYKLIGQVYPDEFNVEAETMIKEFTVLSEKDGGWQVSHYSHRNVRSGIQRRS